MNNCNMFFFPLFFFFSTVLSSGLGYCSVLCSLPVGESGFREKRLSDCKVKLKSNELEPGGTGPSRLSTPPLTP